MAFRPSSHDHQSTDLARVAGSLPKGAPGPTNRLGRHLVVSAKRVSSLEESEGVLVVKPTTPQQGDERGKHVSMAKVFCANMKQYVSTTCVQLFGGSGYIWENPAARAFVDSRLATIGGGADEVMKEVVAKILKI